MKIRSVLIICLTLLIGLLFGVENNNVLADSASQGVVSSKSTISIHQGNVSGSDHNPSKSSSPVTRTKIGHGNASSDRDSSDDRGSDSSDRTKSQVLKTRHRHFSKRHSHKKQKHVTRATHRAKSMSWQKRHSILNGIHAAIIFIIAIVIVFCFIRYMRHWVWTSSGLHFKR